MVKNGYIVLFNYNLRLKKMPATPNLDQHFALINFFINIELYWSENNLKLFCFKKYIQVYIDELFRTVRVIET